MLRPKIVFFEPSLNYNYVEDTFQIPFIAILSRDSPHRKRFPELQCTTVQPHTRKPVDVV